LLEPEIDRYRKILHEHQEPGKVHLQYGDYNGKRKDFKNDEKILRKKKPDNLFNDLNPKFSIFKEKNKRQCYKREELLGAYDIVKGNPVICNEDTKKASLRRRLIKKKS
jgi:hypothetical protein